MKRLFKMLTCLIGCGGLYADGIVSDVTFVQDPQTKRVTISYSLAQDAVITLAVEADGTSIDRRYLAAVLGDVNRRVSATGEGEKRTIYWKPTVSWTPLSSPSSLKAIVRAWPDASPPDYFVCDLRTMRKSYYETEAELPYGCVTNRIYKTDLLVMKKIPAAGVTWWMGDPSNTGTGANPYRKVRLSRDYYISVFLITYRQWDWMFDAKAGTEAENAAFPIWSGTVAKMNATELPPCRTNTGLDLQFPTSAQWEYACRAGTAEARYCKDSELREHAWISDNSGVKPHEVGTRKPNPWGLYDMYGNMNEYVLDYYSDALVSSSKVEEDPTGPVTGDKWIFRGSSYQDTAAMATSFFVGPYDRTSSSLGFRLAVTLPAP